jgi:hypothetical protein
MSILTYDNASARPRQAGRPLTALLAFGLLSAAIGGAVKQVATYTVTSAADAVYTLEIKPSGEAKQTITYNEGAAGSTSSKATGLAQAINANGVLGKYVFAKASAATVIVTARTAGQSFVATESDSRLTLAQTTANGLRPKMRPGTICVADKDDAKKQTAPNEDNATAKVMTVTPAGVTNNERYVLELRGDFNLDGKEELLQFSYQDSAATAARMLDDFKSSINARMPANSIAATESGTVLTLTSELAGLDFSVNAYVSPAAGAGDDTDASGSLTVATSTANVGYDFGGIVVARDVVGTDSDEDAHYDGAKGHVLPFMNRDRVSVRLDDDVTSISMGDPVLFRVNADGDDEVLGACRNAKSGTDAFPVPASRARWIDGEIYTDIDGHSVADIELI